jgi:hypothetical protein
MELAIFLIAVDGVGVDTPAKT